MSRHKNLMMRICCAAVLALGLAACGGKTVAPTVTPTPPAPVVTTPDPAVETMKAVRRENGGHDGRHGRSDGG